MKKGAGAELQPGILNLIPSPILIHAGGKVIFANDIILGITGNSLRDVVGKDVAGLLADPADRNSLHLLTRLTGEGFDKEQEFSIRTERRNIPISNFLVRNSKILYMGQEAVMTILTDITERKHLEKYVISKVIETEEKDRKQFAADLHDDLGPTLSSIKLHLGLLEMAKTPEKLSENLKLCLSQIDEAIAKMRRIANNLMPRLIVNFGLESALNSFFDTMQHEGVFSISFFTNIQGARFPKPVELHLYRIICELVNNTIKHAGASEAKVSLKKYRNRLTMVYTDNGKGYDVEEIRKKAGGLGIGNLIQRAVLIDAQISFARKGKHTVVTIIKDL